MKKFILGLVVIIIGVFLTYHLFMIVGKLVYSYTPHWVFSGNDPQYIRVFGIGLVVCVLIPIFGFFAYCLGDEIINFKKKWNGK